MGRIVGRLEKLERGAATAPQERAIDRAAFGRMSTADLLALEETCRLVEDLGEEPSEEQWACFEAVAGRFFQLRGEVRADS